MRVNRRVVLVIRDQSRSCRFTSDALLLLSTYRAQLPNTEPFLKALLRPSLMLSGELFKPLERLATQSGTKIGACKGIVMCDKKSEMLFVL